MAVIDVAVTRIRVRVCGAPRCRFMCDDPLPETADQYEWPDRWDDHRQVHPGDLVLHSFMWRGDFAVHVRTL